MVKVFWAAEFIVFLAKAAGGDWDTGEVRKSHDVNMQMLRVPLQSTDSRAGMRQAGIHHWGGGATLTAGTPASPNLARRGQTVSRREQSTLTTYTGTMFRSQISDHPRRSQSSTSGSCRVSVRTKHIVIASPSFRALFTC